MPMCPYCFKAKQFLKQRGIAYKERKILNPLAFREMKKISNSMRVPIVKVKDRVLTGFSHAEYEEVFALYQGENVHE